MNSKTKKRLAVVSGVIIIVLILILAFVGGNTAARSVSIAEATQGDLADQKIKVSGNVVTNSFSTVDNTLLFSIYDPQGDPGTQLEVAFDGGVSATFGNDIEAICTGKIGSDGVLHATELVTKCPSKYESITNALTIEDVLGYGDKVLDKTVKVTGVIKDGSLKPAGQGDRFVLEDESGSVELPIEFDGALSDEVKEGSVLIVTGAINSNQKFVATEVALEG